jgi:indole-3-glycerol phosphate synthase
MLPKNILIVSESGIAGEAEINVLKSENINGVLIGEHFMCAENISDSVKQMKEYCKYDG